MESHSAATAHMFVEAYENSSRSVREVTDSEMAHCRRDGTLRNGVLLIILCESS